MHVFTFSDPGPRTENQDSICVEDRLPRLLAAVADGVGGNNGGKFASTFAIESLVAAFEAGVPLAKSAHDAHEQILNHSATNPALAGMATTLTAVEIAEGIVTGVHCGDSRAYILRGHGLKQLTADHTEVAQHIASGRITKEEALTYPRRNVLTSALGISRGFVLQNFSFELEPNDRLLLMSDGVYSLFSKKEIQTASAVQQDLNAFCTSLIADVKLRQPKDNFSLIGLQVEATDVERR